MSLHSAYLKSLELALNRNIRTDTFVIRKTVSYLKRAISDIYESDPKIVRQISDKLDEYLNSTVHLEVQLKTLFEDNDPLSNRIYEVNIAKLHELKAKVNFFLSP
jgi:hypothetical protein